MFTGTIEHNVIKDAASSGIEVLNIQAGLPGDHSSVAIRNNRVDTTFEGHGIVLMGAPAGAEFGIGDCLIIENTVTRAGIEGIYLESMSGCKLHNNVVWDNTCNGILWIGGGNGLVQDNVSSNNGLNGILFAGVGNHIDRNVMNENACAGLYLTGPATNYGRNTARNNRGGDVQPTCPNAICDLSVCVNPHRPQACWPQSTWPPPPGPGNIPPDFCDANLGFVPNHSFCDNLMPGPPPS